MPFIGWILIIMAASSIIGVMYMVMREHPEHEEAYTPGSEPTQPDHSGE